MDELAVEHHDYTIRQFQQFVEILADQQNRRAAVAGGHYAGMDLRRNPAQSRDWRRSEPRLRRQVLFFFLDHLQAGKLLQCRRVGMKSRILHYCITRLGTFDNPIRDEINPGFPHLPSVGANMCASLTTQPRDRVLHAQPPRRDGSCRRSPATAFVSRTHGGWLSVTAMLCVRQQARPLVIDEH
jgi:hypothetical protein